MYEQFLKVLLVDDDEDDYVLTREILTEIEGMKFNIDWASSYDEALKQIEQSHHDVYLVDYRLGGHNGLELLREAVNLGCREPFILLTGQGDRDVDMEAMKAGASDYLVKGRIDGDILERSIRYSIERKRAERETERLIAELREAMAQIKTLNGMLPICSACKRIRDDSGYWNQLESYISENSDAELSHSLCPTCLKQMYGGIDLGMSEEQERQLNASSEEVLHDHHDHHEGCTELK